MAFKVLKPGVLSLLQDLGRYGYHAVGLSNGGPMDEYAFRLANRLLDNDPNASQVEITYGLLELQATVATTIALCGADLGAKLNDKPLLVWQTYAIQAGDRLSFHQPQHGLRAYLAVKGGFQCEAALGSVSTVMREQVGGLTGKGDKLQKGDLLVFEPYAETYQNRVPRHAIPDYSQTNIPMVMGYQHEHFSRVEQAHFLSSNYHVSQSFDRMGYRLDGRAIEYNGQGIISEGIAYGSIQIPKDGQPIVLLKDRQTIGGYPKMGCVTTWGGSLLSQKMAGDSVHFEAMSVEEEEKESLLFEARLNSLS